MHPTDAVSDKDGERASRPRILFIGEAVTLAHVVRPVVLAGALDPTQYDVTLACDDRYLGLFGETAFDWKPLQTIPTARFLDNLAKGRPVYDTQTLRRYVREDLTLIEESKPDLIVGDFRISLGVSAKVAGIPYATVTNAYWAPHSRLPFPLPEHPMTKVLGVKLSQAMFSLARPMVFALHCGPLNRVRREYGLPGLGHDLREVYTHADEVWYADIPEFVPTRELPSNHHWLGPILWSPQVAPPDWWGGLPTDRPVVYVALGSSGENERALPIILQGLAGLPVTVIAATAGMPIPERVPANARVADFLPGVEAAERSALVICNGGSLATQQALAAGTPVLGVVSNMDQHLNMLCLERAGVGLRLRVGEMTAPALARAAQRLLNDSSARQRARRVMAAVRPGAAENVFAQWIHARFETH